VNRLFAQRADLTAARWRAEGNERTGNDRKDALARLGNAMLAGSGRYRALEAILVRARPRPTGGYSGQIQTTDLGEQRDRAAALDRSYLFIQGPPHAQPDSARRPSQLAQVSQGTHPTASAPPCSSTCWARIVASPRLLESRARTIEQMRLINALCRFVEMADQMPG